ncbi:mitogen-activated protein kinase 15 isoform X4 [Canis lupus dingo]|uniref:mitogen-activated protein kinase 15 isoform X4 n=1 Tax=Canis lupus dingo TaxID=286419 RepID=UPI0003AE6CDD|nr:mitogen-activated protein kinase 15 isoform X4 [Canis lupus dingo]|eukprot:XP_005628097.1 mitogen-activated protein kinase 15 isoform X4 [Canis lupus familiaris]
MCAAEVDDHVAQRYLLKRRLGKGAYGIVWKAVDRRTGEVVAIKKIFDAFRDKTDAQRTFREITLLQELGDHPNIIRLLDVIRAENDRDIYLVFESMDTDLNAVICKGRLLRDVHKRYIFYQLLRATKYIHSGRVIHRDQKPSNILLDSSCVVKLCDFGLARPLSSLPEEPAGQALTDYVATRWYRAPEVLLSSSWYTPGVDMWSLGCILGEMLRGRPLFPGTSTLHQLELILETIPPPSKEDLLALGSSYSASILPCLGARRLSAAQALQHPYVQRFHCPAREWTLDSAVRLPVLEGVQLSVPEYRRRVYQMILERRGDGRVPGEKGLGGTPRGTEPSGPRAHLLKPRAIHQLSPGSPAQKPGRRPQSSPGRQGAHDEACGAKNLPRQSSAPLLQPPPPGGPGRGDRPPGAAGAAAAPSAPSWVEPSGKGAAPSLASQTAAQVTVQALIRSDWHPRRGERAAGARRVPRALPADAPREPRPGRRMFSASASQGAQGAARAALGGYSQAYGTVCRSALGRLPLLPGPRA